MHAATLYKLVKAKASKSLNTPHSLIEKPRLGCLILTPIDFSDVPCSPLHLKPRDLALARV